MYGHRGNLTKEKNRRAPKVNSLFLGAQAGAQRLVWPPEELLKFTTAALSSMRARRG